MQRRVTRTLLALSLLASRAVSAQPAVSPPVSASKSEASSGLAHDESMRVGAILATRAGVVLPVAGDVTPFARLHLARLLLMGSTAASSLRYLLSVELTREPYLRDLELTFALRPEMQIHVGRFRAPFSRQFLTSRASLALMDRSIVSDFFRAGRGTGIAIGGPLFEGRAEYRAGVFDALSGVGLSERPLAAARWVYAPMGSLAYDETTARQSGQARLAIGLSGYSSLPLERTAASLSAETAIERGTLGLDVAFRAGRWSLFTEAAMDRRRYKEGTASGAGVFVQAGVFLVPGTFELAGRVARLAQDLSAMRGSPLRCVELGVTYFMASAGAKIQGGYVHMTSSPAVDGLQGAAGHEVQIQVQLAL